MSYEAFQKTAEKNRLWENDRISQHGPECYGKYGSCISCGCLRSKNLVCPSHKDSDGYKNSLLERIAIAQEKIAGIY